MSSAFLPIEELSNADKPIGIARLASQGESILQGHDVEYFTLPSRSLLNRCVSKRKMPFTWTINPYRGCEFACKYCYARYTHEFMEMRDGLDFERKIYVKQQTAWLLRQDLRQGEGGRRDRDRHGDGSLSAGRAAIRDHAQHFAGDGPASRIADRHRDQVGFGGPRYRRAARGGEAHALFVNMTITTLNTKLARILEPRAPRPDLRLEALTKLTQAGIAAGVICAPVLPGITDSPAALDKLVRARRKPGSIYLCRIRFF